MPLDKGNLIRHKALWDAIEEIMDGGSAYLCEKYVAIT